MRASARQRLYRVVAAARPALQSAAVAVLVLPQVTLKLSSEHPRAGRPLRVSGYVYPKENGAGVELQFAEDGKLAGRAHQRTWDVDGSLRSGYSFVLPAPHRAQRVRVVVTQSNRAPSASHQHALRPR